MDCPRCKLSLRETDYEGVKVDMCDTCWGMWLDKGELQGVVDARGMSFSAEERRQFANFRGASPVSGRTEPGRSAPGKTEPAAACPRCGGAMEQVHSDTGVHLVIDRCPAHGVWLDTGEIKAVQVAAEGLADLHRLLLDKLGVRQR